jgi:hypothetical protein
VVRPRLQLVTRYKIFVVILGDAPASKGVFSVIAKPSDLADKWRKEIHRRFKRRRCAQSHPLETNLRLYLNENYKMKCYLVYQDAEGAARDVGVLSPMLLCQPD